MDHPFKYEISQLFDNATSSDTTYLLLSIVALLKRKKQQVMPESQKSYRLFITIDGDRMRMRNEEKIETDEGTVFVFEILNQKDMRDSAFAKKIIFTSENYDPIATEIENWTEEYVSTMLNSFLTSFMVEYLKPIAAKHFQL